MVTKVRILDPTLVNQIAAGEVVERPASVVKELIENSLDAGGTEIHICLRDGGQSLIRVIDNGYGMNPEDLELAVERHATSKIPDEDLFHIQTLGFRGEALPSLGAVSRFSILSRSLDQSMAWMIKVEGGKKFPLEPGVGTVGTRVEVKDLFFATPARLKFMKSPKLERGKCVDILQKFAMAYPGVGFQLSDSEKIICSYDASDELLQVRLQAIWGKDVQAYMVPVDLQREGYHLTGWVGLPTWNRASAQCQHFFVNNRPVQERLFHTWVRLAYHDHLSKDRYPYTVLFLRVPLQDVDVNVHPAKTQVRFRNLEKVRQLIISGVHQALQEGRHRTSPALGHSAVERFHPGMNEEIAGDVCSTCSSEKMIASFPKPYRLCEASENHRDSAVPTEWVQESLDSIRNLPLGEALAQIHRSYIVSQTSEGLVLVDQHAAHERIIYEEMKRTFSENHVPAEALLTPEIIRVSETVLLLIKPYFPILKTMGLMLENLGAQEIIVHAIPSLLKGIILKDFIQDLVEGLPEDEVDPVHNLQICLNSVCAAIACRRSIKAGHAMTHTAMNALLRAMETTPSSGQCNHGRPTSIVLSLQDIEKLFGRS